MTPLTFCPGTPQLKVMKVSKYRSHINVEYASNVTCIGYLNSYITKGVAKSNVKIKSGDKIFVTCDIFVEYLNIK